MSKTFINIAQGNCVKINFLLARKICKEYEVNKSNISQNQVHGQMYFNYIQKALSVVPHSNK